MALKSKLVARLYLVDLAVYEGLKRARFISGFIIGTDSKEVCTLAERWAAAKCKCMIGQDADVHMNVRRDPSGVYSRDHPIDIIGLEDIRSFLADCDAQATIAELSSDECLISQQ